MKNKQLLIGIIIFLAVSLVFAVIFGLYEAQFIRSRASTIQSSFSDENSYVFVSPLKAKANNQEKIRVTVFILNNQGVGVPTKKITLQENISLKMETIQSSTDSFGRAVFDVSSSKSGEYYLEVRIDQTTLSQKAHLSFY